MQTVSQNLADQPLVTILMLAYNRERFIGAAIESVIDQTYQNWELVIINDGSTDTTGAVVDSFTDPRIRHIKHSKNAGLHARRAESLTHATGVYTAVLDSDDIWTDTNKLAQQVAYMKAHSDCVVVGTFITLISPTSIIIGNNTYHTSDQGIRRSILSRNQFTHSSILMRTSLLQHVPGYRDTGLAEDLDLFLQLGTVGTFANIPKYMTSYRIHTDSFNPQKQAMGRAVLGIIQKHKDVYPNYIQAYIKAKLRLVYLYVLQLLRIK